ncbi:MAG: Pseudomurein-binding repeat protein [Methanobacterium sp. PtaU1.Bin242]|nr:MAG: Pseudomurein-binding repeat protein [Methanobacterium sp. PtaU1.Bin242]
MGDVSAAAGNSSLETNQSNISNQSIETQTTSKVNNSLPTSINSKSNGNLTSQSSVSQNSTYTEPTVYANINLVSDAANKLKTYVETNNKLPNYVTISNYQVTLPQFLELLTDSLIQINSGSTSVTIKTVGNPTSSSESLKSGNIYKTEYLNLAQKINDIMETTGTAPGYIGTSIGKMGYESLVYDYSKILSFYYSNKRLPNYVSVKAFSTANQSTTTNQSTSEGTNTTNTSGTPPKNGYGPYNVVVTSKYVSATAKCSCGAGKYTYKTATFLNYCPQCHHYGTLGMTKYPLYEGHWTCSYCDCDYCAQCGKENIKGSKLWLTPA